MPTIEEKISASEAEEQRIFEALVALPGADVIDADGWDLLRKLDRQRDVSQRLAYLGYKHGPVQPQPGTVIGADAYKQLADTYTVEPAPEPEPPTLVATEPPVAPAEAPVAEAPVAEQG